jgi:hypothetical protein
MKGVLNLSFINREDDNEEYILQLIHKGLNDINIHTIVMHRNHLVLDLLETVSNGLKSNTTLTDLVICKKRFSIWNI